MPFITHAALLRILTLCVLLGALTGYGWLMMITMPGTSYRGPMPALSAEQTSTRETLRHHVEILAGDIGERNLSRFSGLQAARDYLEVEFRRAGYEVRQQEYTVEGKHCANLDVELLGASQPQEIVIIGAHYDSVMGSPGADDNATGMAAVLELARAFAGAHPRRTLRFVGFVNEEPPWFQTPAMGSLVYAKRCRAQGERIVAMLSLETIGYYTEAKGSQHYPFPFGLFYPSTGNFIGFVGNVPSRGLVRRVVASFRGHANYPSEGIALPGSVPGVSWSDQWAFWTHGYPAMMVTDTAPFRYPSYHTERDTPDQVNYDRLARVVVGLKAVVEDLVGVAPVVAP